MILYYKLTIYSYKVMTLSFKIVFSVKSYNFYSFQDFSSASKNSLSSLYLDSKSTGSFEGGVSEGGEA